jgi:zinc protease
MRGAPHRWMTPAALALGLALFGCGAAHPEPDRAAAPGPASGAQLARDDDPFEGTAPPDQREPPPPPGLSPDWSFPSIKTKALPNGLPVHVVERRALPIVDVRLVLLSGSATDGDRPGLAVLAGELLKAGGAGKWNSRALLDHAESLGSSLSVTTDRDATTISMAVTRDLLDDALEVIAAVATQPRFDTTEFTKLKRREMDRVESQARSDAGWAASMVLYRELFQLPTAVHPYARYDATSAEFEKISLDHCRTWHRTHATPKNAFVVVVGDVTADQAASATQKALGAWTGEAPPRPAFSRPLPPAALKVFLVDRPGSPQAEVFLATLGPERQGPEWPALRVTNQILGGGVAGRLFLDVREKRSLAYRTHSNVVSVASGPVPILLAAGTQTAKAGLALGALLEHFNAMGKQPSTDEELGIATRYLSDVFLLSVDTVGSVGSLVAALSVLNLPAGYYDEYRKEVRSVDQDGVRAVASRYFVGGKAVAVVAGDAKRLDKPLSRFAPVVIVDPEKAFSVKRTVPHDPTATVELDREQGT